ncbi:nuclear transport factor 2 family protein [Dyella sp. C9]|uniref:nuclear transport factor 2 family protein n=1 Tax=Dyella sp. C9 TaxID=2202154 RepID=UPI001E3C8BD5|nr:nuclear transport factor 2 family protein [Dyella sp. C9]
MRNALHIRLTCLLSALFAVGMVRAETPAPLPTGDALVQTISALDTKVFDAYNTCDLKTFGDYFSEDVEFYHDNAGLMTSRDAVVDATRRNICHKVRRELVGKLEVFPIKDYGAMEVGTHRFCQIETGKCVGEGRFLNIWRYKDGQWQMTRVVSYDHHNIEAGK